ncbi:predicted protein [Nematostella vectensis]|uniref:Guanylate cyclase n=1 Tax=Nematostella vectensis TaxID=45351 RepID=A7SJA4_NEMVE|nr:predicted protein [Nematostella vectensis]|eukprot:XP_001628245.1 predicted protein [Nematostella vectensis]
MKMVRDLHHANLNRYLGVCVESPNICMVSRFCNRGTLQDLLGNDSIKLDWMFRQSFANDIATGMEAIHNSPIQAHGNLKSSNCLIDSRWACKITDYGLDLLRANQTPKDIGEFAVYKNLFWTAPELLPLADGFKDRKNKTQAGDVYSYGIVLYEIITRDEPYSTNTDTLSSKDVIELVRKRQEPAFRPQFSKFMEEKSGHKMVQVTQDCWDNDAQKRPTFSAIKKKLKANGMGNGKISGMFSRYYNNFSKLVISRMGVCMALKRLLVLSRPIADELKKGNSVSAESFQSVTIFFSDIVGFTSVAAQSTPLQVVDLLNQLYTRFDKVVDEHDVYKVETIGDAYMVVSGLPVRNGERHAGEVASMALNLLSEVRDFQIPHIPSRKVQLRIGIHSGSCVAGVVGLKMPRYCLFGDTVNYASRMESSGLALRIHVSPECKEVLDRLGGYHLDERGPVTMKGKGTIVTYFLTGKDGFDKPLPDVRYAAALADHEFK